MAVEPDDRMREVLIEWSPASTPWPDRGESIPLPDASVDAVLASSSWHWMEPSPPSSRWAGSSYPAARWRRCGPGPTPMRVSSPRPGNCWPAGSPGVDSERRSELSASLGNQNALDQRLEIPPGVPFGQLEQTVFTWEVALNADELIGLLGTFSWVILMDRPCTIQGCRPLSVGSSTRPCS